MSTRVASLASFGSFGAASAVVVVVVVVVACRAVYEAVLAVVSLTSDVAMISSSLGDDDFDAVVLAFGASVLDAVGTAFTAAIFASKMDAFSRHFFLWLRLPCPGPGTVIEIWDWCAGDYNCCWRGLVLALALVLVLCGWCTR